MPSNEEAGNEASTSSTARIDQEDGQMEDANPMMNVSQLQSRDQAILLGAIDRLRYERIDYDISIPQIVVCGDQSSGKSSVLEAIAGVPFAAGASTTTRFATELILRQSGNVKVECRIKASPERPSGEGKKIEDFRQSSDLSEPGDLKRVVESAWRHLDHLEPTKKFWKDWLQVEISGPRQPHLTLIDLPGIIHYEHEGNVVAGDKARIKTLVSSYLRRERTTVLAVGDALNNLDNQEAFGLSRSEAEERTLGVITKPDLVPVGSDLQRNLLNLVENETLHPRLGWHVLKNLPHEDEDRTSARRDELERNFFASGAWSRLDSRNVGVESLRKKLSDQLFHSITRDLPGLVVEMRNRLHQCKEKLRQLGPARVTATEKRLYLSDVLSRVKRLIEAALEGDYHRSEFEGFFDGAEEKRLRDQFTNNIESFASKMREYGRQYHVHADFVEGAQRKSSPKLGKLDMFHKPNFFAPYTTPSSVDARGNPRALNVPLERYCTDLAEYMQWHRGKDLAGWPSTKFVKVVFRQMSLPWTRFAEDFGEHCYNTTRVFLEKAIKYVAGDHTGNLLLQKYVYPTSDGRGFDSKRLLLEAKIKELLWPYKESHPMIYHPRGNPRVQPGSVSVTGNKIESWGAIARDKADFSNNLIDAADVLDRTEGYYNIALDTFIENIATLGLERCLLENLPDLIAPTKIVEMADVDVDELTAEPQKVQDDRRLAERQEAALEDVIRICQRYADYSSAANAAENANELANANASSMPNGQQPRERSGTQSSSSSADQDDRAIQRSEKRNAFGGFAASTSPSGPSASGQGSVRGSTNAPRFSFSGAPMSGGGSNAGLFVGPASSQPVFAGSNLFGGNAQSNARSSNNANPFGKSQVHSHTSTGGTVDWTFTPSYQNPHPPSLYSYDAFQSLTAHKDFKDSSFEVRAP